MNIEYVRERIFAKQLLKCGIVDPQHRDRDVKDIFKTSMRSQLYSSLTSSLVTELDIPFFIMRIVHPFRDFPLNEVGGFEENVRDRYRINEIGEARKKKILRRMNKLRDKEKHGTLPGEDKAELERIEEEYLDEYSRQVDGYTKQGLTQKEAYEVVKQTMETSAILSCIDNDTLKEVIIGELNAEKSFSDRDPETLFTDVWDELGKAAGALEREGAEIFHQASTSELYVQKFNSAAWDCFEEHAKPLRSFILNSWEHHVEGLMVAMSLFDFRQHQALTNGCLTFAGVPAGIVNGYHDSMKSLRGDAIDLSEKITHSVRNVLLLDIESDNEQVLIQVEQQREYFANIAYMLEKFAVAIDGKSGSANSLSILDVTPTGFLNSPLPPL